MFCTSSSATSGRCRPTSEYPVQRIWRLVRTVECCATGSPSGRTTRQWGAHCVAFITLLGIYAGRRCAILSRTGRVVLFFFVCFCSIRLFLVICVEVNVVLCGLHPLKIPAILFFCHDTDCRFVSEHTRTPSNTHSCLLSYTEHFGKYPISGMPDLWVIYWK